MGDNERGDARNGIQVIARAAAVLRSLKNVEDGLSLGQIAERVELPRSTVQRIVGALMHENMVTAASPEGGIRLGPEISALAESAQIDVGALLRPYLADLSQVTGETVDLAVLRGRKLIFIDQMLGSHRLRTISAIGESFPLSDTANGKACLAKMDNSAIDRILAAENCTGEARVRLLDEIAKVRQDGLAYDLDEHTDGISAVGVALSDLQGTIYAISIPTPSARFRKSADKLSDELRKTYRKINNLNVIH